MRRPTLFDFSAQSVRSLTTQCNVLVDPLPVVERVRDHGVDVAHRQGRILLDNLFRTASSVEGVHDRLERHASASDSDDAVRPGRESVGPLVRPLAIK